MNPGSEPWSGAYVPFVRFCAAREAGPMMRNQAFGGWFWVGVDVKRSYCASLPSPPPVSASRRDRMR